MKGVIKQFVIFLKPTIWKLAIFLFLPLVLFIFKGSDGLFFLPAIVGTFLLGNLCLPLAGHQCSIVYTGLENSDTKFQFDRYGCMMELYEKNNILGQTKSPGCPGSY